MTSRKQIHANWRNAQKSTGPKTANGRAASSNNALKHGVLSSHFVAPHESKQAFDELLSRLAAEFEPATALETLLVERIAILFWRERRLAATEAEQVERQYLDAIHPLGAFALKNIPLAHQHLVGRYQSLIGRQIKEALRDLISEKERRLQNTELANTNRSAD